MPILYVKETGPANAPTIVFLHGGGVSGWMWGPQIERLGDYHCLVPDLPEHGQSSGVKPFSILDAVARINDLIRRRAHDKRAHVVGLSLGGQITTALLAAAPEVVDHAVLSGTLVRPLPGVSLINAMVKLYMPFKDLDFMIRANMQPLGLPEKYFAQVKEDTRLMTAEGLARVFTENMRFSAPAGLSRANVPTLVLAGQKEYGILRKSACDLVNVMPKAKAYLAPNVGHAWNIQNPDLFTRALRAWITDQPLPPELLPLSCSRS